MTIALTQTNLETFRLHLPQLPRPFKKWKQNSLRSMRDYPPLRRKSTTPASPSLIRRPSKKSKNLSLKLKTTSRPSISASASFQIPYFNLNLKNAPNSKRKNRTAGATLSRNFWTTITRWRYDKVSLHLISKCINLQSVFKGILFLYSYN